MKVKTGVARVIASIVGTMPYVVADLTEVDEQRLVDVALLAAGSRHKVLDPRRERHQFPYWPA